MIKTTEEFSSYWKGWVLGNIVVSLTKYPTFPNVPDISGSIYEAFLYIRLSFQSRLLFLFMSIMLEKKKWATFCAISELTIHPLYCGWRAYQNDPQTRTPPKPHLLYMANFKFRKGYWNLEKDIAQLAARKKL